MSKKDLIVFGEDWGAHPSSTQHLVNLLAADRRVLWVNSIGLRRPRLNFTDLQRLGKKFRALLNSRGVTEKTALDLPLQIIQPRAIPLPGNPVARVLNRYLLAGVLKPAAIRAQLENPVLWISLPTAVDVIGTLNESAVVYYCGDDFGALAGVDHGPVLRLEKELAAKADLILAASPVIAQRFSADKTRVIPHGVDLELFSQPVLKASDFPEKGPVAGFYGSLADWLDVDLIVETAQRLPHWTFVFIGSASTDISRLQSRPNIRMLGPRQHSELAAYSQHWDASLLPFRDTDQIRACNPLKLREYLAAGSPVVSTEFPALDGYRDLISVAGNADEFADALLASLGEEDGKRADRRERIREEGWDARARQVAELIDGL